MKKNGIVIRLTNVYGSAKKYILLFAICAVTLILIFKYGIFSIEKRQTLREAKNVVLNANYLGLIYYGTGQPVVNTTRTSGMAETAEEQVLSYSAAEGDVYLTAWDSREHRVIALSYQKDRFLVRYEYNSEEEDGDWEIYWSIWDSRDE